MIARLDAQMLAPKKRLFFLQGALLITGFFLFECFLMTYLAFPVPTRPLFLWASLTSFEIWLLFRIGYAQAYRERPTLRVRVRERWNAWLPVQRNVFIVIAILAVLYFAAFIPTNLLRDRDGTFFIHADEKVLYPDVTNDMVFPNTISGMVHSVLESWSWQYGYPYFVASAAALLIPRMIFGNQFSAQIQLNIFLLRQFVSVLPMILAMMLAVYLATRYKSMLTSVGLFVFMATVPGIVKYNDRFWHADSMVVLLVVLTIFALEKDNLRFGRFFYLAAVFCNLAAAMKLWGLFFGPTIGGYLLAGLVTKRLSVRKMFVSGALFILAMLATIFISSPTLMAPYIARVAIRGWLPMQGHLLTGYAADTTGEYNLGLINWLKYFGFHFMKPYFFYFAIFALAAGALWGSRRTINWIQLGWCLTAVIFVAYFVALKNFQYMLPVVAPLYCGAFLFPSVTDGPGPAFLHKPGVRKTVEWVTLAFFASQLVVNLVILCLYAIRGR